MECEDGGFIDHTCKCVCPLGDHKSCAVTNSIFEPHPVVKEKIATTTTKPAVEGKEVWISVTKKLKRHLCTCCENLHDNALIE